MRVFISYAHADVRSLKRLHIHLKLLERQCKIDVWDDRKIRAGSHWRNEIQDALSNAHVAVLLISADFLASDFIVNEELPRLLNAETKRGLTVLPVIVGVSQFCEIPSLVQYQAINLPEKPLIGLKKSEQETILKNVADRIQEIVTSAGGR